jgi:hypothetical protein
MNAGEYRLDLLDSLAEQAEVPAMIHEIVDNGDDLEVWATFPANPEYDVITFVSVEVVGPRLDVVTISTLEPAPGEYAGFLGSVVKGIFTALTTDPHRQHLESHRAALVAIADGEVTAYRIAFFVKGSEVWYQTQVHAKDSDGHWHMVPMSAPLDECTEHEIHPALATADAMVRIDAQKAWAKLMQVGQQMEVANPAPVNQRRPNSP